MNAVSVFKSTFFQIRREAFSLAATAVCVARARRITPTLIGRSWWITTTTTTTTRDEDDGLDHPRRGHAADTRRRIRHERQAVLRRVDPQIYKVVHDEIGRAAQHAAAAATTTSHRGETDDAATTPSWAMGPGGRHLYRWTLRIGNDGATTRRYECIRREEHVHNLTPHGISTPRTLLELSAHGSRLRSPPSLSHDERYLAHVVDDSHLNNNGSTVVMTNTDTGQTHVWQNLPPNILQVEIGARPDAQRGYDVFFLQSTSDDHRPSQIWRGTWSENNEYVMATTTPPQVVWSAVNDPTLYLHVQRTKGGEWVALQAQSLDSNQVFLWGPRREGEPSSLWPVATSMPGRTHSVDVGANGDVFVLVQDAEKGHCLLETTVDKLPLAGDAFAQDDPSVSGFEIIEFDLYRYWLVLYETSSLDGTPRIRVVDRRTAGEVWIVELPPTASGAQMFQPVDNAWYDASACRFQVDTPVEPSVVYEYNFVSRRLEQITPSAASNAHFRVGEDDCEYECERVAVSSHDGTMVPLTLMRRRRVTNDSNDNQCIPVVLTAYGAYGCNVDLSFNPAWQPLLDRGYVIAWAHIRGGRERGITWHAQGRREHKVNGVLDYLSCARALQQYLLGGPVRLIAKAYSAGGVTVASAVNRQPDLFDQVVLTNTFLDVYATMRNTDLSLTEHEWDEYGNPLKDENIDALMRTYCPVQTAFGVEKHPLTLLVAALHDQEVPYWNALCYADALRHRSAAGAETVCVLVEDGVGHDLGDKLLHLSAVEIAFILSGDDGKKM